MITNNDIGFNRIEPQENIYSTLERLQYENDLLKECVRFYATMDNWYADEVISYHTARECLENIGDTL
jgi:hypothetical protein